MGFPGCACVPAILVSEVLHNFQVGEIVVSENCSGAGAGLGVGKECNYLAVSDSVFCTGLRGML